MKRLLILLSVLTIHIYSQIQPDTINKIDTNGKSYGYWQIIEKNINEYYERPYGILRLVSDGRYLSGKKIGLWYYTVIITADTSVHECQQEYSYLGKTEFFENDGSVTKDLRRFDEIVYVLKYNKDSTKVSGEIYSKTLQKKMPLSCNCLKKKGEELKCTLKTKQGKLIESFNYKDLETISEKVFLGLYNKQLK